MAKYRLQALLEIRERAEEEAKENFALATNRLREEEARPQRVRRRARSDGRRSPATPARIRQ